MIDLKQEETVTLAEAARVLPRLRGRKRVHVSTLYRWISRGVRGVRLEAVHVGGTLVTSREALQRFADRLTSPTVSSRYPRSTAAAAEERTERELDRHGL